MKIQLVKVALNINFWISSHFLFHSVPKESKTGPNVANIKLFKALHQNYKYNSFSNLAASITQKWGRYDFY